MNAVMRLTTVMSMLTVPTLLVTSPVPATRDTMEMASIVMVSSLQYLCYNTFSLFSQQILMNALKVAITVTPMQYAPTLLVASHVPVTRDTVGMVSSVLVS